MAMSVGEGRQRRTDSGSVEVGARRYLRAPHPLYFPESAELPGSRLHLDLRTLLYQLLKYNFAKEATIGCDQFVYWDPTDPRACLAPDAFVQWGQADERFVNWKVWERGAPDVAVEILSDSNRAAAWPSKLAKYERLGVAELVSFDPYAIDPLLIWDRIEGRLIERKISGLAASHVLPGCWLVVPDPDCGPALRLSADGTVSSLFLTGEEAAARRAAAEAQRAAAEAQRAAAEAQRAAAEAQRAAAEAQRADAEAEAGKAKDARIRELEAELAKRQW